MSIVEFDGLSSWSLDASGSGDVVLSPVSLASRDQDGGPSNTMIDIYVNTEKEGTVSSLF